MRHRPGHPDSVLDLLRTSGSPELGSDHWGQHRHALPGRYHRPVPGCQSAGLYQRPGRWHNCGGGPRTHPLLRVW